MKTATLNSITTRPPVVIVGLTLIAVFGFVFVSRLVDRFTEQEKALARHLYQQGLAEMSAGRPERAIEDFRAALSYNRGNFDYELSLARALRDKGRTDEAQAYLVSLWERSPQDAAVNLALARLAARQKMIDKTMQYYHNAIYGVWSSNADTSRLNAWFELNEFLLRMGALPQAQAELITLAAELPARPTEELEVADDFLRAQDYEHALAEYIRVLRQERENAKALAGAGEAAFDSGRYGTASRYLQAAVKVNPKDQRSRELLQVSNLILANDPSARGISDAERNLRVRTAFAQAGKRLDSCSEMKANDSQVAGILSGMTAQWAEMKHRLTPTRMLRDRNLADAAIALVFQIEKLAAQECGPPSDIDRALLLLAQGRGGVQQ